MTLPDESRDVIGKSQEIWNWLVHPPQNGSPLGVISCHSVGDAPTNSKFLDFSNKHPYFHLVKSFFTFFFTSKKKMASKFFFDLKKNDFLTKMVKNIVFLQILAYFVSIYVISML